MIVTYLQSMIFFLQVLKVDTDYYVNAMSAAARPTLNYYGYLGRKGSETLIRAIADSMASELFKIDWIQVEARLIHEHGSDALWFNERRVLKENLQQVVYDVSAVS